MNRQEIYALQDEALIWACVEPYIQKARGKDPQTKAQVLRGVSGGPRALFLFQVLYGHAKQGIEPFFEHIDYLAEQLNVFQALQAAMRYFQDPEMLLIVEKMEQAFRAREKGLENAALMSELNSRYSARIPLTLKHIGQYIKNHPEEFHLFEE